MHSLEDIKLVPNLATRACGGTVVYPEGFQEIGRAAFRVSVEIPVGAVSLKKK